MKAFRRTRDERGAQAVEFALLALPILILTYGVMALGFVLFEQVTASQLAREAARSAAICHDDDPYGCALARFNTNLPPGFTSWNGQLVDANASDCDNVGAGAVVSVEPALPLSVFGWGLDTIQGKATTPCGG